MASGGKRGAGERVLESKHVIGLFLLMLLFSGVFFTLGYVMGRNQYDMQVRAATNAENKAEPFYMPRNDSSHKKMAEETPNAEDTDPSTNASNSHWINTESDSPANMDPKLEPAPGPRTVVPAPKSANAKNKPQPQPVSVHPSEKNAKSAVLNPPAIANGTYVIQVAALVKQDDAVAIASSLQKKHYAVYVQRPQKDKYYRVQVGPFKDQKNADAAKKGLEGEGFKAFYVKH